MPVSGSGLNCMEFCAASTWQNAVMAVNTATAEVIDFLINRYFYQVNNKRMSETVSDTGGYKTGTQCTDLEASVELLAYG